MLYKTARKVIVAVIGATVVLFGMVLWFLPGPGMLFVFAGLAILATEFLWARHLLKKVKDTASDVAGRFTGKARPAPTADAAGNPGTNPSGDGHGSERQSLD